MKKFISGLFTLCLFNLAISTANASPITGLFNTGAGISTDQETDTHYTLTDTGGNFIFGGFGAAAVGPGFPITPWIADNGTSHWLTPTANRSQSFDTTQEGTYVWSLAFDLTGYNPTSAGFAGRFSADNNATAILNGNVIGNATDFTQWYSFAATSNLFVSGINKLEFVVTNLAYNEGANPTGLRVEFTSSDISSVPLPGAAWLFLSSLLGFLAINRKKHILI
ncbi:MAG: hypothetical protein WC782_11395 [Methylococcaceae bacterium]